MMYMRNPPFNPSLASTYHHYATANRDENARLDIKARGFEGLPQQCAYFDVRVFTLPRIVALN